MNHELRIVQEYKLGGGGGGGKTHENETVKCVGPNS